MAAGATKSVLHNLSAKIGETLGVDTTHETDYYTWNETLNLTDDIDRLRYEELMNNRKKFDIVRIEYIFKANINPMAEAGAPPAIVNVCSVIVRDKEHPVTDAVIETITTQRKAMRPLRQDLD